MKKSFLLLLFSLVVCSAFSQDTLVVASSDKSNAIVSRLTRELNLDKAQQKQVYNTLQKRWTTIAQLKADKKFVDHAALNKVCYAGLQKIFSTEQYDLFIKLREEKKKERLNSNYALSEEDKDLDL